MGRCHTPPPHIPLIGTPQYIYIYTLAPQGRENRSTGHVLQGRTLFCRAECFSAGQNAFLSGRTKDHQSYSIYILWHLSVAKIVLPSRRAFCAVLPSRIAFCRVEQYSAGQNEGSPTIYISYIYTLAPPGHENRSAGFYWLFGRTNRTMLVPVQF